jgi:hypothetical protein
VADADTAVMLTLAGLTYRGFQDVLPGAYLEHTGLDAQGIRATTFFIA